MQRVLIVRLSAMGDILHAMPAVTALRQQRPELQIGWLIEDRWQPLLRTHESSPPRSQEQPLVDHVHLTKMATWRKAWLARSTREGLRGLVTELRECEYDSVIDFQGALRSALLARASKAKIIVGEDSPREWLARYLFSQRVKTAGAHVIEQDLEIVSAILGASLSYSSAQLPRDGEAARWAQSMRQPERPLVLMNPGAGWGAKQWPAERYGTVAKALWGLGCQVLVNAGPNEQILANQVVTASGDTARIVECSISRLIELTRLTSVFIGGDTGPLHLAAALWVPTVAIFGPTDPARNGPFGTQAVVLRSPKSRRDHSRHKEPEAGLLTIGPGEVIAAARNLLERTS